MALTLGRYQLTFLFAINGIVAGSKMLRHPTSNRAITWNGPITAPGKGMFLLDHSFVGSEAEFEIERGARFADRN